MLVEPIRHFLEAESDVFEADFLGHRQQRHRRKVAMGAAHQPSQHGGIAHSRVEDAEGRRRRPQLTELLRGSFRDDGFFVAGIDEGQVLLSIVVEPERRLGLYSLYSGLSAWRVG